MFALFCSQPCLYRFSCPDSYGRTYKGGERMHLIYKGDHSGHRPTWLSKHCAASRQRLAGRSSNHIFHLHTFMQTHAHTDTHTPTNLRCIHIRHTLSFLLRSKKKKKKTVNLAGLSRRFFFVGTLTTNTWLWLFSLYMI